MDASGSAYVTGWTLSADFPGTGGNVAPIIGTGGSTDAFVTKLNPAGSAIVYSTYLGGTFADVSRDVGVHNTTGNACVVGDSQSKNTFPTTPNAFQNTVVGAGDVFVTCLNSSGSGLVYSTFLSGNNGSVGRGVDVHSSGNVYATGRADSQDFPITANAFTGDFGGITDVFVAVIDPTMTGSASLLYSTFLGGFSNDVGEDVAADAAGNAYVTGQTLSTNTDPCCKLYPIRNASQALPGTGGSLEAFFTKLDPTLAGDASLLYSTFIGGSSTENSTAEDGGIDVDSAGLAYVAGTTASVDFPTTPDAFQVTAPPGVGDAFLTVIDPLLSGAASLVYSTYLGGSASDQGTGVAVGLGGDAHATGYTLSNDFPGPGDGAAPKFGLGGGQDVFFATTDRSIAGANGLIDSAEIGGTSTDVPYGIAADVCGSVYLTGETGSKDNPVTQQNEGYPLANPMQATIGGGRDAFITKLDSLVTRPV